MDARTVARILAAGRIGIGMALFAAPATAGRMWFRQDLGAGGRMALRGLGARDLAIGVGTLLSLDEGDPSGWLDAGIVADVGDTAGTLLAAGELESGPVIGTAIVALGAAAAGFYAKSQLGD